jgi:type II secretory pathway pseudopilin PulG
MRINEQGRSMIEMLGVLAIVGVLSVGGIAGYSKAMNKFKTNKVIDQINMISTNIRTLYSSQRNYDGLNNNVAIVTGIIPSEMYNQKDGSSASVITNAFGGQVDVKASGTPGDTTAGAYIIAIDGIPAASCISIATTDWGGDSGSGLMAMYVSGSAAGTDRSTAATALSGTVFSAGNASIGVPGDTTNGLPFTIIRANTACAVTSNGTAAIAWKFM